MLWPSNCSPGAQLARNGYSDDIDFSIDQNGGNSTPKVLEFLTAFSTLYSPCLFRLFAASGHQKLPRTAKHLAFQPASIKFVWVKTIQNQHKHIIG
jgi:hypothetical protein